MARTFLPGEAHPEAVLGLLQVPHPGGGVRFRITRYFSEDGASWVRHGPFTMHHDNGTIATEGEYRDGLEEGVWRDHYENGQLAAEGCYRKRKEEGYWRFWLRDGTEQPPIEYVDGEEVVAPGSGPQRGRS